jgi:hypothetical protein
VADWLSPEARRAASESAFWLAGHWSEVRPVAFPGLLLVAGLGLWVFAWLTIVVFAEEPPK